MARAGDRRLQFAGMASRAAGIGSGLLVGAVAGVAATLVAGAFPAPARDGAAAAPTPSASPSPAAPASPQPTAAVAPGSQDELRLVQVVFRWVRLPACLPASPPACRGQQSRPPPRKHHVCGGAHLCHSLPPAPPPPPRSVPHWPSRHGARTPLGRKYWPELRPVWDVCGEAYEGIPVAVTAPDGTPNPHNPDDQRQAGRV